MAAIRLIAIVLLTSLLNGQEASTPQIGKSQTPKPKLPVVDDNACPGKGRTTSVKVSQDYHVYSSWKSDGKSIGTLKAGEEVTALGGVNLIREPDIAVIKYDDGYRSLKVGDAALSYGIEVLEVDRVNGVWDAGVVFWSNGVWFLEDPERVAEQGVCGLGDSGCSVDIIKYGVSEWWVQVKTNSGLTGWVLAEKFNHDKDWSSDFVRMCHFYED
jgi:hypothetical protein